MHCRGMHLSLRTRALTCQAANFTACHGKFCPGGEPDGEASDRVMAARLEGTGRLWRIFLLKMISVGDFSNFW